MLHDKELAADAVQDALTKLWHMRWRLGLMKNAQGFAMRTLQNICLDKIRHTKMASSALADFADTTEVDEDMQLRLAQAIENLPERQRKLIDLKYKQQMSSAEIAQATGMSVSNVDTTMSRTYSTLRKMLENDLFR